MANPFQDAIRNRREKIESWVNHLEHVLPGQAPLGDFIHHNTLHGYQQWPFPEALARARQVTGIPGYLPIAAFRRLLEQGRITRQDLAAVVDQDPLLQADEDLGPCKRREVLLAGLCHDLGPVSPSRLNWEMADGTLARSALWQACLAVLAVADEPADLTPELRPAILATEGARVHLLLMDQIGSRLTLRGLLLALTGQDILLQVRPYLVRQLAGFLDQGLAAWPLPRREEGFFVAWQQVALTDPGYWLEDLPDWRETIENLPADAVEVVTLMLLQLGLPEDRWHGYLERLALELPGWSGLFLWRHRRPGYLGLTPQKVAMMDYLAVRLVLERLAALRLCRDQWDLEPRLEVLGWHFHSYPAELILRWHLFQAEVPEFLACRIQMLLRHTEGSASRQQEWLWLAQQYLGWRAARTGPHPGQQAWPLYQLARHLGLTADQLRQGGPDLATRLLATLDLLDEERAGYLWLQAYERPYRNAILASLAANRGRGRWAVRTSRPQAQVVFCMDDREEGIRRHLEERNPRVETLGAAGFFGVAMHWQGLDDTRFTTLCPIVVHPVHQVREIPQPGTGELARRHRQRRHWRLILRDGILRHSHRGLLVPGLLSLVAAPWSLCALFAKTFAPLAHGRLAASLRDHYDLTVPTTLAFTAPDQAPAATVAQPRPGLTIAEQASRVEGLLRTMGLTHGLAPLVVIMGHGSISANNPHLAAYDCGACSGRHGGPNARLFAAMANEPAVRAWLRPRGIDIPDDTWFVGAEHNTCDEAIQWYDLASLPPARMGDWQTLQQDLQVASALSAQERCRRLAAAPRHPTPARALDHVTARALDFSQARPELGHVTNAVAFIGRRSATQGVFFDRRMFLISYDPTQDAEGQVVENILVNAGPVGAGISLEYYFSTVDNERFGCGTKVVHNVTGFFGVMEGTSSDLRTGLPRQMIEIHEAMRLLVVVEQTPAVLTAICQRQPMVAELVVNAWIQLASLDPCHGAIHVFQPATGWQPWQETGPPLPRAANSPAWYEGRDGPLPPALIRQPGEAPHD